MTINWEHLQKRSIDPYETFSSDVVNSLNRILSSDGRGIVYGLNVSIIDNKHLKLEKGCFLKDSVLIELTEDFIFTIENENYINGENILVFNYRYEKIKNPNKATIKLISKNNYNDVFHLIICIVNINNDEILSISNFSQINNNIKRELIKAEFINNILNQIILNSETVSVLSDPNSNQITLDVKNNSHSHDSSTITSVDWNKIINKPNINILLTGDVSGYGAMNQLNNVVIETNIENNNHIHDDSTITSVDWNKIINKPNIKITLTGDVTGYVSTYDFDNINIVVNVDNDSHEHSNETITSVDWNKITNKPYIPG